jgi:hypothetical protein
MGKLETGHAKNMANFDELLTVVIGYGTIYKPSKSSILLPALQTLATNARNSLAAVNNAAAAYHTAVANREVAFSTLSKLCTRILNAIKATDTTEQIDDNAKSLVRKIQGTRAAHPTTVASPQDTTSEVVVAKTNSSSQMGFDNRLDTFDKLIKLLIGIALYAPNEADMKTAALTTFYTDLKTKNTAVVTAAVALTNARIARNEIFYKLNVGLVDLTIDIKNYIRSIYGSGSPQLKQVTKLAFKNH